MTREVAVCNNQRRYLAIAIGSWVAWAAAGCSSTAPVLRTDDGTDAWSGRFHLKTHTDRAQTVAAMFTLEGSATQGQLLLSSPLGTTLAQASWSQNHAWLVANDQTTQFSDMDALTTALMGSAIPVWALFDWLKGKHTVVEGWDVRLDDWAAGRIAATRTHPLPLADIRILIDPPQQP